MDIDSINSSRNEILKDFCEQSGIDPNAIDQSVLYEEILDKINKQQEAKVIREVMIYMNRSQDINKYMDIPSQIDEGQLDQTIDPHKQFAKYNHQLEINRWSKIGGKSEDDGIKMIDVD